LTATVETEVNVHDRVALPEPATLVGEKVQSVLFEPRLTVALNPLKPETVIVELPFAPTFATTLVGPAEIENSGAKLT
jgi:hypothetical protein